MGLECPTVCTCLVGVIVKNYNYFSSLAFPAFRACSWLSCQSLQTLHTGIPRWNNGCLAVCAQCLIWNEPSLVILKTSNGLRRFTPLCHLWHSGDSTSFFESSEPSPQRCSRHTRSFSSWTTHVIKILITWNSFATCCESQTWKLRTHRCSMRVSAFPTSWERRVNCFFACPKKKHAQIVWACQLWSKREPIYAIFSRCASLFRSSSLRLTSQSPL